MNQVIAKNLWDARLKSGLSIKDVASVIGVSPQNYSRYELGVSPITAVAVVQLAVAFKVRVDVFFDGLMPLEREDGVVETLPVAKGCQDLRGRDFATASPSGLTSALNSPDTNASRMRPAHGTTRQLYASKHILLVDDDPDVMRMTGSFLRKAGFDVTGVTSGDDALVRLAAGERFDALITDYAMPGISGLVLIELILERAPGLPVLIVTGHPRDADLITGRPDNVRILAKPYSRNLLLGYIERLVGVPHVAGLVKDDS